MGWHGLGGVARSRVYRKHQNYVLNFYRSPENAGRLAGSRWGVGVLAWVVNIKILFGIYIGALKM